MISTGFEQSLLSYLSSSSEWLGTTVSPLCSAAASRLQQCLPSIHVSDLIKQKAAAHKFKGQGSAINFGRASDS